MNNLALKGFEAVLRAMEERNIRHAEGVDKASEYLIGIDKMLPVAAGIAGGSGNAAVTMLGLNAIAGSPFTLRELMTIGVSVGADVPFSIFMNAYRNKDLLKDLPGIEEASDAAWISGIGDAVEATEALARYVIMANPGISVSTADAYRAIDEIVFDGKGADAKRRLFINDLEKYTLGTYPEAANLKRIMEELLSADEILMSGSGPTIAAYYKEKPKAAEDAQIIKKEEASTPGLKTWLTSTGTAQEEA